MRRSDAGWLAIGVAAVSTSAPLVREADAPALGIAVWRNLLAAVALAAVAAVAARAARRRGSARRARLDARERRLVAVAGILLGGHFATWIPSVERTTVASSVALVCTQPVWAALLARARGDRVGPVTWGGIALALAGVVVLTGVDVAVDADALVGDALALAGGILAAAYVTVGAEVRRTVPNVTYTLGCYGVAGVAVGVVALGAGDDLVGYDARTWAVIAAITVGPQLLGHSVFNHVLPAVGATVVSVAVLLEVVGATLLAWWWSGEVPPAGALPAAALLLAGVATVVADRGAPKEIAPVAP
jgi:drug/metabolite transporter (DMT)-like permease